MESPTLKKRTRTNVRQSKYGCLTCKQRRVKCDEAKPSCRRCLLSKVSCLGYPLGAPPGPSIPSSTVSVTERSPPRNINTPLNHYAYLACAVLGEGPRRAKSEHEIGFWSYVVPQMIHSIPSVQAAAAAFGASYDERMLKSHTQTGGELMTTRNYHQALRMVQDEVLNLKNGTLPCIVSCLLMGFTETLQQRTDRAYMHLQGAFAISARFNGKSKAVSDEDDVSSLLEKLNLHTATWRMSSEPVSPAPGADSSRFMTMSADRALYHILQACYHFISTASPFKYVHLMQIPYDLLIEQGRHRGDLQQWLAQHQLDTPTTNSQSQNEQLLVLRMQCLAAFIYVSSVLNPYETAYDRYGPEFHEIILSGETVLNVRAKSARCLPPFTPEMGIIQPLFLTGLKYRNPFWRSKAVDLLRRSGSEGPWCGRKESRILETVIHVEESDPRESSDVEESSPVTSFPDTITEDQRVHSCLVVDYLDRRHESVVRDEGPGSLVRFAKVQLSKCRDLDAMLSDDTRGPCRQYWEDQTHWYTWFETVALPD
ncbi:hypothetical protein HG530_015213 [Fusarium avenaceum]|nr:hypothetical protein HG530_015213 [Fusarium avenaceum]